MSQGDIGQSNVDQRGTSEVVGIILLFGMVLTGAVIVALAGGSLIDSLQSETEFQQVELTSDVLADQLTSAANDRDGVRSLPTDTTGDYVVSDDGTVQLSWDNETDPNSVDWGSHSSDEVALGTIELQHGDVGVVHQGGGVWRESGDAATMQTPPAIGFDNASVQLDFMQIDGDEFDPQDPAAAYNQSKSIDAFDDLSAEPDRDNPNLAIRIQTEYSDGWYQAFEQAFDNADERVTIEETSDNEVRAVIENVHDGLDAGPIIIEEDRGIEGTDKNVVSPRSPGSTDADVPSNIEPDVVFENVGSETEDADVNVSVLGHEDELSDIPPTQTIGPDERLEASDQSLNSWRLSMSDLQSELEPGNTYEYMITVVNDSSSEDVEVYDELESPGQFFYLYEDEHYEIDSVEATPDGSNIDLSASVQNLGAKDAKDGDERNVTLEVSHTQVDEGATISSEVDIASAEAREVSWDITESEWLNGEYEFTVRSEDDLDGESGTFEINDGIEAVVVAEDNGIPDGQQIPGTEGQVVDEDDEITVNATILNTHDGPKSDHEVTVDILGQQGGETTTDIDIDSFEAKEVSLDLDISALQDGEIYEYDITTEDDNLDTAGTFLLREPVPELEVTDVDVLDDSVKPFESVEVEAEFENNESVEGDQFVWLEGFDGSVVGVEEMTGIDRDEEGLEATLEWGNVSVVDEQGTVTVQTPFDSEEATVDIEPRLEVDDVWMEGDTIDDGESAKVEAELTSLGGEADQQVTLRAQDGEEMNSSTYEGTGGTITLETNSMERTEYVTVETEDESMRTAVVVEREGPECGINYDGSGTPDDPYQISTIDELQCINEHDLGANYELIDDIPAHGTEYWSEVVGVEWNDEEKSTSDGSDIEAGDQFTLSETPVVEGSVVASADYGYIGSDPEVELISPEEGIIKVTDGPDCGLSCGDLSEMTVEYQYEVEATGFDPIGSEGHDSITIPGEGPWDTFKGDFDGNGNTIEGLHIDRPDEDYVGLFGATSYPFNDRAVGEGSTVENIILEDIHVVGNMYVGGLAGQAGGEVINARAEGYVEANHQLVGGLIGLGAHADIDNRIVADVEVVGGDVPGHLTGVQRGNAKGIGGLIGRAAWETEIANGYSQGDVRGPINVGGIMGSSSLVDSEFEQMYSAATVTATNGQAGAITGIVQSDGDQFNPDMYYDTSLESSAWGEAEQWTGDEIVDMGIDEVDQTDWIGNTTAEMTGLETQENMSNLDFESDPEGGPWVAVPDDYPRFAWELEAEGFFDVEITDADDDVLAGEVVEVEVDVTSFFEERNEEPVTQQISLEDPDGNTVDSEPVELDSTLGDEEEETVTLRWDTGADDDGTGEITVRSEDEQDSETIEIDPADPSPGSSPPGELDDGTPRTGDFDGLDPGDASNVLDFNVDVSVDVDTIDLF